METNRTPAPSSRYAHKRGGIIALLRAFFVAMRLTPFLGAYLAFKLYFVPNLGIRSRRKSSTLDQSRTGFEIYVEGKRIKCYRWGTGPAVLLVHGWESCAMRFESLILPLLQNGFSVLAFDAPGHGYSSGASTDILEITGAMRQLENRHGPFEGVVAHSFGGVCAVYALATGLAARTLILISTPCSFQGIFDKFCDTLRLEGRIRQGFRDHVERRFAGRAEEIWSAFSPDHAIGAIDAPILILHDKEDAVVPYEEAAVLQERSRRAEVVLTEGFGHNGILRSPAMIDRCLDFLRRDWAGPRMAAGAASPGETRP